MSNDRIPIDIQANVHPVYPPSFPPKDLQADMNIMPMLDKRLVTDNFFWKSPLQADLEINTANFQRQINATMKQLRTAEAAIDLQFNIKSGDIQTLVSRIQAEFKKNHNISLFNKDSHISPEHVRLYLDKFFKEVRTVINANTDKFSLEFQSDFTKVEEQFLRFKAKMNLELPVTEVDFSALESSFTKVIESLRTEISNTLPDALDSFFTKFETDTRKITDSFNDAINNIRKNIADTGADAINAVGKTPRVEPPANMPPIEIPVTPKIQIPEDAVTQLQKAFNDFFLKLVSVPVGFKISDEATRDIQSWINTVQIDLEHLKIANPTDFLQTLEDIFNKTTALSDALKNGIDTSAQTKQMKDAFDSILSVVNSITAAIASWANITPPQAPTPPPAATAAPSTPSAPPTPPPPPPNIIVDTSGLAAALAANPLDVNVIRFLSKSSVGLGWDAKGGGGTGSSKGAYQDLADYLKTFLLQGNVTSRLQTLTGSMQSQADAAAGGTSNFARFSQQYGGSNQMSSKVIADAFKALQSEDLSVLSKRGGTMSAEETQALANIDKTLERVMKINSVTDTSGAVDASDMASLGDTIKQLLERATADSSAGANSMDNLTEIIKSLSTSRTKVNQLKAQAGSLNADDPELVKVLQSIRDLSSALDAQGNAITSAGFSGMAEVQDQASYRERRVKYEQQRLGRDLTGAEIQDIDDEWLQKINTLPQILQAGAAQMETLGKTADKVMEDLSEPKRWKGITDTLNTALGQAQQSANNFADTLSQMGFSEAGRDLQGVTQQIGNFTDTMQRMRNASKQINDWGEGVGNIADRLKSQAGKHNANAASFTKKANQAKYHAERAASMGNPAAEARYTAQAAKYASQSASFSRIADSSSKAAGLFGNLAKAIGVVGSVAGKAASVVGVFAPVFTTLIESMIAQHTAALKAIQAARARAQEASDLRILTRTNTATLATASTQRIAATNTREWQMTSETYQMRTKMLGMELDSSEKLIDLEVERMKAADQVADAMQQFQNSITEGEKEIENIYKDRERAGTWEVSTGVFSNHASNANGDMQRSGAGKMDMATQALIGSGTGALAGAFIPIIGPLIGGIIGAGISLAASAYTNSKTTNKGNNVAEFIDQGWGSSSEQRLQSEMNAINLRTNNELEKAARAEFKTLNAPIQQLATEFEAFGKFLPTEDVAAFGQSIDSAAKANARLADSQANMQHGRDLLTMTKTQLEANNAVKDDGYLWDTHAGYSTVIDGQTIIGKTMEEFRANVQAAMEKLSEVHKTNGLLARAQQEAAQMELKRLADKAQIEQAVFEAQKRGAKAAIDAMQTIHGSVMNFDQSIGDTLASIGAARIKQGFEERQSERDISIEQLRKERYAASGIESDMIALENRQRHGTLIVDKEKGIDEVARYAELQTQKDVGLLDVNEAGISEEEKQKRIKLLDEYLALQKKDRDRLSSAELQTEQDKIDNRKQDIDKGVETDTVEIRMERRQDEFDTGAAAKRNAAQENSAWKPQEFRMDEYGARMRAEINLHQKTLELENSLHQDRLNNIKTYTEARNQAAQKYLSTSLETFSTGRGANPLEEAKKMTLASMDQDVEERRAKIRMRQEMAVAELRMNQEMAVAQKLMEMDAKNREIEMKFQVDLMQWKTEQEIKLREKIHQHEMENEQKYNEWKLLKDAERDKAKAAGGAGFDEKAWNNQYDKNNKFQPTAFNANELANVQFDATDHFDEMQSAQQSLNQEMADMHRNQASEMHGLNMRNIDEEHKHSLAYTIERAKKERELNKEIYLDKFRAQQVELQTSAESAQRQTDTTLATSVFGAKSGEDRMKAVIQYQTDSQYNTRRAQLAQKHAEETERMEQQGATEEQRAQLKQRQEREMGGLDQEKAFKEAIIGALGGTGTLRDLVKEDGAVGSKTGLSETHERLKSSSFGHIQDPAADAVKRMAKEQSLQHAQYMQFWALNVPRMLTALQGQGLAGQMSTINNFSMGLSSEPL